jgi:hypothetical protein
MDAGADFFQRIKAQRGESVKNLSLRQPLIAPVELEEFLKRRISF